MSGQASQRCAVVDAENRFVRWEERRVIHEHRLVHRSVHVLLFDSAGRLLIQRRHRDKQTHPRFWDASCAGHVEESDYPDPREPDLYIDVVYRAVAARELQEELGVSVPLEPLEVFGPIPGVHYEWMSVFHGRSDGPFVLQADEVEEHRMLDRDDVAAFVASGEPVTHALQWFLAWMQRNKRWPAR